MYNARTDRGDDEDFDLEYYDGLEQLFFAEAVEDQTEEEEIKSPALGIGKY